MLRENGTMCQHAAGIAFSYFIDANQLPDSQHTELRSTLPDHWVTEQDGSPTLEPRPAEGPVIVATPPVPLGSEPTGGLWNSADRVAPGLPHV